MMPKSLLSPPAPYLLSSIVQRSQSCWDTNCCNLFYTAESKWLIQQLMTAKFCYQALSNNDLRCCQRHFAFSILKCQVGSRRQQEARSLFKISTLSHCLIPTTNHEFAGAVNHRPPRTWLMLTIFYYVYKILLHSLQTQATESVPGMIGNPFPALETWADFERTTAAILYTREAEPICCWIRFCCILMWVCLSKVSR